MLIADDFPTLTRKVEQLRRDADRAAGAESAALDRLKGEYGCPTLAKAEALLAKKRVDEVDYLKKYNKLRKAFDAEFGELLDEVEL